MFSSVRQGVRLSLVAGGAALAVAFGSPASAAPGVTPSTVDQAANPGASFTVNKTVRTPEIPPNPDIVLLVDTTGSMGPAIANVRDNLHTIVTSVKGAQPTAQFAVASYKDESDGAELFTVRQALTPTETDVQAGVDSLAAGGGGDTPEGWLNALYAVSTGAVSYRPDSSRIVVLVGDASSHDPSGGHSLADANAALTAASTKVVAVNVDSGGADGLDAAGQATAVVGATGGQLVGGAPADVTAAILAGLKNLDVTVTPEVVSCDTGLAVTFDKGAVTVPSGNEASYVETVAVAGTAPQGGTLHCTVRFLLNGKPAGDEFNEQITVRVNDVVAPTPTCAPGPNPDGHTPKPSEAGFLTLTAVDNVDAAPKVFIRDTGSPANFGPYPSGTTIKLTQAPGSTPSDTPGTGDVDRKIKLKGDLQLVAVDAAGNVSAPVTCLVPPPPK